MDLKQSIIKTLAYFDIFDYPLTKEELFRYLYTEDMQVRDYTGFLDQLEQFNINNKDGFYFLPGREDNIVERQSKIKLIEKKMKIGYRGIKKLRWIPFLRAVFVCNTVASGSVDENSDIDLFIITNTKRLWLVRFFATVTLKLFGLRTSGRQVKDKICLSFYVAEDSLNLESVTISTSDIYMMYWISQLIPIYDPENYLESIGKENNWIRKYLPNALQNYEMIFKYKLIDGKVSGKIKKILEKLWTGSYGDLMDNQAKGMQQAKLKMSFMDLEKEDGTKVILNDKMLKFHKNDRREEYKNKWEENYKRYVA